MNKRLFFAIVMLFAFAVPAMAYDFSAVAPNGQTLYYSITDASSVSVSQNDSDMPTGDLVIPSSVTDGNTTYSVTSIGNYAFWYCFGLTSVTIPGSVTSIGDHAFYGCSGLTSVTIPSSVTSIRTYAFGSCSYLTSITVESGNTVYDSREGCNAIIETATNTLISGCKNTVIPEGVTSIGDNAFYYCSGLTSVTIPSGVTSIGNRAFSVCSGLTSVTIPEGVTSIGEGAFAYCSGLTSISIPEGVTSIGVQAFEYCSGLTSVTIPSGVTSIGHEVFAFCSGLTSVTIPEGVTSIGDFAFRHCSGLTSIECLAMVPPTMGTNVFNNVPTDIPVYVPCGKVADYQATNGWSSFANIQELDGCVPAGPTNIAVYADGNDIVVEGAAGNTVTLYDNGGNTLSTSTAPTSTPLRFEGLSSGTYYVKIGVLPARMKVEVR